MKEKSKLISQEKAFKFDFGYVPRSSAVFYYKYDKNFKTTIIILNYWKLKRGADVVIFASTRGMSGNLVKREIIDFKKGMVIQYSPVFEPDEFEGSIEIEVMSSSNLFIPYSAVTAVYETKKSISAVHSYGRFYSHHEIEEENMICEGRQSSITINESKNIKTSFVVHNGNEKLEVQECDLSVQNHRGERKTFKFSLCELKPYETKKIYLSDVVPELKSFTEGKLAFCSAGLNLKNSVLRYLVCWETNSHDQIQVTHTDFDYSYFEEEMLKDTICKVISPSVNGEIASVAIHGEFPPGELLLKKNSDKSKITIETGKTRFLKSEKVIDIISNSDLIPSRIHTEFYGDLNNETILPFHVSVGAFHSKWPLKRFWWGSVISSKEKNTKILIDEIDFIEGSKSHESFTISLYSSSRQDHLRKVIPVEKLEKFTKGVDISEIFPEACEFLDENFGYYTLYYEGGNFFVYSLIENSFGSITLEHGF